MNTDSTEPITDETPMIVPPSEQPLDVPSWTGADWVDETEDAGPPFLETVEAGRAITTSGQRLNFKTPPEYVDDHEIVFDCHPQQAGDIGGKVWVTAWNLSHVQIHKMVEEPTPAEPDRPTGEAAVEVAVDEVLAPVGEIADEVAAEIVDPNAGEFDVRPMHERVAGTASPTNPPSSPAQDALKAAARLQQGKQP